MFKVFIDGSHGTTGLRINEYICRRQDIEVIETAPGSRKDVQARLDKIREADVSILCLPDSAAREIAELAPEDAVLIDTSTAHRTSDGWVYGMPELAPGQRDLIRSSTRIANPGCHASGFILLVRPLIDAGLLDEDALLNSFCITGYSGGGKSMIAGYEDTGRAGLMSSPAQYALGQSHKHLPEMMKMTGLRYAPCFSPVVSDYYSGMVMTVQIHSAQLARRPQSPDICGYIRDVLRHRYEGERLISVSDGIPEDGFIYSNPMGGSNSAELYVSGNSDRILLIASYDNLGKGASGAAVQNLNILLGADETEGLLQG